MARMNPVDRKADILASAVKAATEHGFAHLRLTHIAAAAECSNALVVSHFGTMVQMRRAVMRAAIKEQILPIIAEGVAMRDPSATKISDDLKRKALASLTA